MQLKVNENNEIVGFATLGGFPDGVEIEDSKVPEGFTENFRPGKYKYTGTAVEESADYVPPKNNRETREKIAELKNELAASDYKAIKYAEGWLSEEEYAPVKAQRQEIRDKINELEAQL